MQLLKNHYVLASQDAEKNACYLVDVLGFEHADSGDAGWSFVHKDGTMMMIGQCPDAISAHDLGDHSYFAYLVVDDADAYYREITANGGHVTCAPADQAWGMREFGVQIPDGHRIMIGMRLGESR